jgi:hypothetical protein
MLQYNFCIGSLQGLFNRPPLRERIRREFVFALTALKQCRIRAALCWLPAPLVALKHPCESRSSSRPNEPGSPTFRAQPYARAREKGRKGARLCSALKSAMPSTPGKEGAAAGGRKETPGEEPPFGPRDWRIARAPVRVRQANQTC